MARGKNAGLVLFYFILSGILTWGFIALSPLYISAEQMMWSGVIAGGKWLIQLVAAFLFLQEKKWDFMRRIGFVCLIGSALLIPAYLLLAAVGFETSNNFLGALFISVAAMIFLYYRAVLKTEISLLWLAVWLQCLAIAISLQLTVIFNVWNF
jgi:hypothetical protein